MTLDSTVSRVQYEQSGAATEWPVPFKFPAADDLVVIKTTGGTDTTLILDTDYSVTGAGADEGGTVTISPAVANGTFVTIYRVLDLDQPTQLSTAGGWYPNVHEAVFDRLAMQIQQVQEEVSRSVKVGVTSAETPDDLMEELAAARDAASASALSAAGSASDAADQVALAAAQVSLAEDQVALAAAQVSLAEGQVALAVAAAEDAEDARDAALAASSPATTTTAGLIEIATSAEVAALTDTDRAITPSSLSAGAKAVLNASGDAPVYATRAWVAFNGTANPAVRAGYGNVSSVTYNAGSDYTVNFATEMPDANYHVDFSVGYATATTASGVGSFFVKSKTTAGVRFVSSLSVSLQELVSVSITR
jgi:hypothetical protein